MLRIHNANKKIYAKESDEYNRNEYTNKKNSEGKQFAGESKNSVGSNFTKSQMDASGNVIDAYTGKSQKADTTSPDHIAALSQYHKDGGFMQTTRQKADFATDERNLALTGRNINQSMRDFDKQEWQEKETIKNLKNKDRYDINEKLLNKNIEKGDKVRKEHLPTNTEKLKYYSKNAAITGAKEAGKMGLQQAVGLIVTEFFTALFDEIIDIYKNGFDNGFDDEEFLIILKERIKKIGKRVSARWQDALIAFKDGSISGFISNLVTVVINKFVTTGKRIARIVREGIFSLFKAVKILLFPPENMSFEDRMHEAKKLIATGVIISLGVIAEEIIDGLIKGSVILEPLSDILTTIL